MSQNSTTLIRLYRYSRGWQRVLAFVAAAVVATVLALALWPRTKSTETSITPVAPRSTSATSVHKLNDAMSSSTSAISVTPIAVTSKHKGMEVCGIGYSTIDDGLDPSIKQQLENQTNQAMTAWTASLANSGDYSERAIGVFVSRIESDDSSTQSKQQSLTQLIQLARESNTPMTFAIAHQACLKSSETESHGFCARITPAKWSELDPDNAVPWLLIAWQKDKQGNTGEATETLLRAANAHRIQSYGHALIGTASELLPRDATPIQIMSLYIRMTGIEAAWTEPHYTAIRELCKEDALRITRRPAACRALTDLLIRKSTTTFERNFGISIGKRMGRNDVEIQRAQRANMAMTNIINDINFTAPDCDSVYKVNTYFRMRSQIGEIGTAQFMIDQSGKTIEELEQAHMDAVKRYQESIKANEQP